MFQSLKKYQKLFVAFCLVAFIYEGFLGATHSAMQMSSGGKMMNPCPFMGQTAICNMSPLEHIGMWQMMFTALPAQTPTASILLAVIFLVVFFFVQTYQSLLLLYSQFEFRNRWYSKHQSRIPFFNNLQLALAQGIVHGKAY